MEDPRKDKGREIFSRSENTQEKASTKTKGYIMSYHAETFMHTERNHTAVLNCSSSCLQFEHLHI